MQGSTYYDIITVALVGFILYKVNQVVYRLCFSPLAKFPGPKFAAATRLYELYFDVVKDGQFMWEIDRMHKKYGPIVRINPNELHIHDPDFYDDIYSGPTRKRDKDLQFVTGGWPGSSFGTAPHALHRLRRGMLSPFFSKQAVMRLEPTIQEKTLSLCNHFYKAIEDRTALELHACFVCFAVDMVSSYAFGESHCFGCLDEARLSDVWKTRVNTIFEWAVAIRHFPFLYWLARYFPIKVFACHRYGMALESVVRDGLKTSIGAGSAGSQLKDGTKPIFLAIANDPKLPPYEKDLHRLEDEAIFLLVAGVDAPSQVLAITMFHVLRNPDVFQKLNSELLSAIPDPKIIPSLAKLESLPYLSAVIKEGLRLSAVVTSRLPRIAMDETIQYQHWKIPPGTPVSSSIHLILRDPKIFTDALTFVPDRWIQTGKTGSNMEKYLVPFSKGTAGCLGPNMAYAWLYIVLATILRKFEFRLDNTTEENITIVRDCFNAQTKPGLNMINVKVLAERA
ncbi:hypothetical protein FQN57_004552 [Myotisia sp. PD_48]|nr:hypothetical protein FQN57_004552 [Myotisia sp. PD_48]